MGYDPLLIMAQRRSALHRSLSPSRVLNRLRALGAPSLAALALGAAIAGCAYRVDISQGNIVEQEDLDQVEEGMTRSQVQFLLGTPMIADPFHADRWDYPYYFIRGRGREETRRWFVVHFENDRVARIEHRIGPESGEEPGEGELESDLPDLDELDDIETASQPEDSRGPAL